MISPQDVAGLVITIDDLLKAGHCPRGAKKWCDTHGVDYWDFSKNGIAAERLLEHYDGHVEQLIRRTLKRRTESNCNG